MHERYRHRRRRRGRRGREPKLVFTSVNRPPIEKLTPTPKRGGEPIVLDLAELEALKLVDLEGLSLEEAGLKMNVSRSTVWRLVRSAREKLVRAIVEGRDVILQ